MNANTTMQPTPGVDPARAMRGVRRPASGAAFPLALLAILGAGAAGLRSAATPQGVDRVDAFDPRQPLPEPRACEEADREIDRFLEAGDAKRDSAAVASACHERARDGTPGSAVHFCLLARTREHALRAGALRLALATALTQVEVYRVDRFATLAATAEAAKDVRAKAVDLVELRALTRTAVEWCEDAVAERHLPAARRLLAVAEACARRPDLKEFRTRLRRMAGDVAVIEKLGPGRQTPGQVARVIDALLRCCSPARALDVFAQYTLDPIGDVAADDRGLSRSLDRILGTGDAPARQRPGGNLPRLADDPTGLLASANELAARWSTLAADPSLSELAADVCWNRATHWRKRAIALASSDIEKLELSTALARFVASIPDRREYLADLRAKEVSPMHYADDLQYGGIATFGGGTFTLAVKGLPYERCLAMHAAEQFDADKPQDPWARFAVARAARWLRGGVAINDSGGPRNGYDPLYFEIWSGEHLLWWSRAVRGAGRLHEFAVDVGNATVIEIRTRCEGKGAYGHAIWVDPYFLR